jgi:hypothetical protein
MVKEIREAKPRTGILIKRKYTKEKQQKRPTRLKNEQEQKEV